MDIKNEIINRRIVNVESNRVSGNSFRNNRNADVLELIMSLTFGVECKINERIYMVMNDLTNKPKCKCNKQCELTFISYKDGYYEFCGKPGQCELNGINQSKKMKAKKESMTDEEKQEMLEKKNNTM